MVAELQEASDQAVELGVFSRAIRVGEALDIGFTLAP
jgi:hypothetical protein